MAPTSHPVSILAGLQVMVVIVGTFAVRLMTSGYESSDPRIHWNTTALFVRNFGWLFLGVPVIWAIGSLVLERHPRRIWNVWWTIVSGLLLFLAMGMMFMRSMSAPFSIH